DEAEALFEKALALKPDYVDAHWNRSLLWLLRGDLARGWPEYEWRWRMRTFPRCPFPQPLWDGRPLEGQTILLHAEQGLGATLQFARSAPLVRARGATVLLLVQPPLMRLLAVHRGHRPGDLVHRGDCQGGGGRHLHRLHAQPGGRLHRQH